MTVCARPGCGKQKVIPKHIPKNRPRGKAAKPGAYVDPGEYERDPYCSRVCGELDGWAAHLTPSDPSG